MVDEVTGTKFTTFHKSKDDILGDIRARLKAMDRLAGKEFQSWRQDNSGENKVLEQDMKGQHWLMKTKLEYTVSGTPQQNSCAEMGFPALTGMPRAMMNLGNVPRKIMWQGSKNSYKAGHFGNGRNRWGQENLCRTLCQYYTQVG